ncbi:hypothetical protein PASE110613_14380 [Paenibacillus sediminis]|uniref:Uncharacterized protein n=1 Tax=Paenibacillus sediminis TaxID=664909 RepID=A0ABS4H8E0_9BACL|nr:hypothetical protein [Paenibacillus sediminis]
MFDAYYELRKLHPVLYTRLYRNDKSWLDKISPGRIFLEEEKRCFKGGEWLIE